MAAAKKSKGVVVVATDEQEPLRPQIAGDEADETEGAEPTGIGEISSVAAPSISADPDSIVTFVCLEEIDPAPVVGHFKFRDHGIMKLEKMKNYSVPYSVAIHLVDRKKGTIVG